MKNLNKYSEFSNTTPAQIPAGSKTPLDTPKVLGDIGEAKTRQILPKSIGNIAGPAVNFGLQTVSDPRTYIAGLAGGELYAGVKAAIAAKQAQKEALKRAISIASEKAATTFNSGGVSKIVSKIPGIPKQALKNLSYKIVSHSNPRQITQILERAIKNPGEYIDKVAPQPRDFVGRYASKALKNARKMVK